MTVVLAAMERGDASARERLLALVYDELRAMAHARMAQEPANHTLEPTALVHEAYLRLVGERAPWQSRAQFFAAASLAMRRILVDRARRVRAAKHGGGLARVDLGDFDDASTTHDVDLVTLDDALTELAAMDQHLVDLVHLRFFAGLSVEQAAEAMGTSPRTVKRDWNFARAWLHRRIGGGSAV